MPNGVFLILIFFIHVLLRLVLLFVIFGFHSLSGYTFLAWYSLRFHVSIPYALFVYCFSYFVPFFFVLVLDSGWFLLVDCSACCCSGFCFLVTGLLTGPALTGFGVVWTSFDVVGCGGDFGVVGVGVGVVGRCCSRVGVAAVGVGCVLRLGCFWNMLI